VQLISELSSVPTRYDYAELCKMTRTKNAIGVLRLMGKEDATILRSMS